MKENKKIIVLLTVLLGIIKVPLLHANSSHPSNELKICVRNNTFECIHRQCENVQQVMNCKKMCYQLAVRRCLGTKHQRRFTDDQSRMIHSYKTSVTLSPVA